MRFLVLTVIAIILAACTPPLAKRNDPIRTLTIASAFGERIEMRFVGLTVFNNAEDHASVDWQIDRHVRAQAAAALAGRYQLRDVSYNSGQFFIDVKKLGVTLGSESDAIAEIRKAIPANAADAVLVFLPFRSEDRIGLTYHLLAGPGFYGRTLLGMGKRAAFFSYQAVLLDGSTMQPIGVAIAKLPRSAMLGAFTVDDLPYRELQIRWYDTYAEIPPAERAILRDTVFALFDETVPSVLQTLGLR